MPDAASTAFGFLDLDWAWAQLSGGNPVPFVTWTVAAFIVGLGVGMALRGFLMDHKVRSELGLKRGFERVNSVERLIEKADELSGLEHELESLRADLASRPTANQLAESEGRVSELEREVEYLRSGDGSESARIERLVGNIRNLTWGQRRVLSLVLSSGERWIGEPDSDRARALERYGYLECVASSLSKGSCYVVPLVLREAIGSSDDAKMLLSEAEGDVGEDACIDDFSRTFSFLNNREKYCVARIVEVENANKGMSVSKNAPIRQAIESLANMGIVTRTGSREIGGKPVVSYTISPEWREWLRSHTELFSGVTEADAGLGDYTITRNQL